MNNLFLYDMTVESTTILYGPGKRIVLWCSGCHIRCPGCTNIHLWNKDSGKQYSTLEVYNYILSQTNIEGITLHGGEPSEQLEAFTELLEMCGSRYNKILFTGKEIEDFVTEQEKIFIGLFDIVKCGPFIQSKLGSEFIFMGSSNQRIINQTNRIQIDLNKKEQQVTLFKINFDGSLSLQGFPKKEHLEIIKELDIEEEK